MIDLTKRQVVVIILGLALAAVLIWSAASSAPQAVEMPAQGGTYVEGLVGQPKYLNPILSPLNPVDEDISSLVFSGLTKTSDNGVIEKDLAASWEISSDGKTYIFDIRSDARWHDGWPVTADDVVFTIKAIQSADYQGNPAVRDLWKNVVVERVNDTRVKFTLKDSYAPFLEHASQRLVPMHILGTVPPDRLTEDRFNIRPVGTGPFKVVAASLKEAVLEPNQDYYGQKPLLGRITFRFYPDTRAAVAALAKDEVQGVGYLLPDDVEVAKENKRVNVFAAPEFSKLTLLLLNTKSVVFGDKVVRQAVSYAIDRQKLVDTVMNGQAVQADSPVPPVSWAYNREVKRHDYDPARARAMLDSAGWLASGNGIREKNGQKLALVILTNDRPQRVRAAEEISRQLEQVGVKVEVQAAGWSGVVQDFLVPRFFQAALAEQWSPGADPDTYQFWHSSQSKGDGLNFASWTNRSADELLENARRTNDAAERAKQYRDFQSLFAEEQPGILLYYSVFNYAVSKNIKGVRLGLMVEPSHRFDHIGEWYIRTQRVDANGKSIP
ncbi:MAG: hypothetical protein HYY30_06710 [Chloroflexi bacterium]|nr:hypothetical protein [Chloroflexota bacterium]